MIPVHYFFDPLCGWCYGVAPLIAAVAAHPEVTLELHGGGLWPRPTVLPAAVRQQIRAADARVGQLSGQPYGTPYLETLLPSDSMVLESVPVTAAVLAGGTLRTGGALAMLRAIQTAHYVEGLHVVERDTLARVAEAQGFDRNAFLAALDPKAAQAHIARSQELMRRLRVDGFPAVFVERDRTLVAVAPQAYLGNPAGFVAAVRAAGQPTLH